MKKLSIAVLLVAVLAALPLTTLAVDDGRVNEVAYLGGIAIYCNTMSSAVTNDFNDMASLVVYEGGNQDLLLLDGDELKSLIARADAGELDAPEVVGSGSASNGAAFSIAVLPSGEFQAFGTDEYGNAFSFVWEYCQPVGPAVDPDDEEEEEEECEILIIPGSFFEEFRALPGPFWAWGAQPQSVYAPIVKDGCEILPV